VSLHPLYRASWLEESPEHHRRAQCRITSVWTSRFGLLTGPRRSACTSRRESPLLLAQVKRKFGMPQRVQPPEHYHDQSKLDGSRG
jgi:hypothetical protein